MNERVNPAVRKEATTHVVSVRLIAKPHGRGRDNPPRLRDLRDFVEACDGLHDDLHVYIDRGSLDEGGRHDVTFSVEKRTSA
jgi:hypothetical protein